MGVVDEIKSRLDIIDVISGYVPSLKKAGRTYKGLCPFHTEKTPSFVVYPDTQTWHCFGACSTGGDVFSFVMRQEGLEFGEALRTLAAKAGVALEERSPEAAQADQFKDKLRQLVATASAFFHEQLLKSPQAQFAREYVAGRGLSAQTIGKFQLGYAPDSWDALKNYLQAKGYTEADLVAAGLLIVREDKSSGYDRFRNRFVVPIRDLQGRVIGFGARALHDNQVPKYLNSPQSALFDKSAILFALDVAKNSIRDAKEAVIVEGYMDVLQAHEHGFNNVVAQMGTALTESQLKLLKRFANRFVLALDADSAGSAATLRGTNVVRESLAEELVPILPMAGELIKYEGRLKVDLRIASLPPGKDPDDVLKADDGSWQKLIQQALPLVDYYIKTITADLDLESAKGKTTALRELLPVIRGVGNSTEREDYLLQLARLLKIPERALKEEFQRAQGIQPSIAQAPSLFADPEKAETATFSPGPEEHCLALIIGQPEILYQLNQKLVKNGVDVLAVEDFQKTENGAIFLAVKHWAVNESATLDDLLQRVDKHIEGRLANLLDLWGRQPEQSGKYVEEQLPQLVLRIRKQRWKQQIKDLRALLGEALATGDREAALQYKTLVSEISNVKLNKLEKAQNALSINGRRMTEEKYLK